MGLGVGFLVFVSVLFIVIFVMFFSFKFIILILLYFKFLVGIFFKGLG